MSSSLNSIGEARADQQWIWQDIADKSARMAAPSETGAMSDLFDVHRHSVDDYLNAFPSVNGQVGAVFAIDRLPVGIDLFADEETSARLLPKIIRSYALDLLDPLVGECPTLPYDAREAAEVFIRIISQAARTHGKRFPTVGIGETVRITDKSITAAALIIDNEVAHFAAFDLGDRA